MRIAAESWGDADRGCSPSAERNREPILEVLAEVLPPRCHALEIASGTGQHIVYFAQQLPHSQWQPSDPDERSRRSIAAWSEQLRSTHHLSNVAPPLDIDAATDDWGLGERTFDAAININMIHISPWAACLGLLHGCGRHLRANGLLVLYGPFRRGGAHTAPSNREFDRSLKARNPQWGVRDLDDVVSEARQHRLALERTVRMPANNLTVVFRRSD